MSLSLTELRQRLFTLADQVIDTGVPLVIERRGVRLRLVREDALGSTAGRLERLKAQTLVQGAPLAPDESPARWSELVVAKVAQPSAAYSSESKTAPRRKPPKEG